MTTKTPLAIASLFSLFFFYGAASADGAPAPAAVIAAAAASSLQYCLLHRWLSGPVFCFFFLCCFLYRVDFVDGAPIAAAAVACWYMFRGVHGAA